MNKKELEITLEQHKLWLESDSQGKRAELVGADLQDVYFAGANLQGANLQGADLQGANLVGVDFRSASLKRSNLSYVDLSYANLIDANLENANLKNTDLKNTDLRGADLRGADLDFSCWPLCCGSLGVKVDKRMAIQLAYHLCALDCDDEEFKEVRTKLLSFANQIHRTDVKELV